jgi:hypothetical protein
MEVVEMGKLSELLSKSGSAQDESLNPVWGDHFPLLMEGFYPAPGKASGTYATPKFSVTLFSEGSRLKAVFGSKMHPRKFWITLDGPEAVLEQVELALKLGEGEWRDAKDQD